MQVAPAQVAPAQVAPARQEAATQVGAMIEPPQAVVGAELQTCPFADMSLNLVTVMQEETPVLSLPAADSSPVTDMAGKPRLLDPRHGVKILYVNGEWLKVAIVTPQWPAGTSGWSGWIRKDAVQSATTEDQKHCLFVDFAGWTNVDASLRQTMRGAALRILREDRRCSRISRGGYLGAGQRFFFTCYPIDGGRPYHYWISPQEADERDFRSPSPPDEPTAVKLCEEQLQRNLRLRATLNRKKAGKMRVSSTNTRFVGSAYYVTMSYAQDARATDARELTAECIVPSGGVAEIAGDLAPSAAGSE